MEWCLNSLMSPKVSHHTPQGPLLHPILYSHMLSYKSLDCSDVSCWVSSWVEAVAPSSDPRWGCVYWESTEAAAWRSEYAVRNCWMRLTRFWQKTGTWANRCLKQSTTISFYSNIPRFLCKSPPSRASWGRWHSPSPLWRHFYLQSLWGHPWALAKNRKCKKCFHTCTWLLHYAAKSIWTFENKRSALSAQNFLKSKAGFILSVASPLVLCFSVAPAHRSGPRSPAPSWAPWAPPPAALSASCWC